MAKFPWEIGEEIAPGIRYQGTTNKGFTLVFSVDSRMKALKLKIKAWVLRQLWRHWRLGV